MTRGRRAVTPPAAAPAPGALAAAIVAHYRRVRRELPWRATRDPYAIWVSEVMLQQTRVATVIPYWERWMARFPDVRALAAAPLDDVLAAWAGLGYYSRARNLHRGAQRVAEGGGALPGDAAGLRAVPGIGPYTAGAIASIAYGERAPLVDGNVARVLARIFAVEHDVKSSIGQRTLWQLAGTLMDALPRDAAPGDLNQGLMELGATVCTPRAPACIGCPAASACAAHRDDRTDALPTMPARRRADELPVLAQIALWVARGDEVLLARRRPDGLYGGLWELPAGATLAAARRALGAGAAATPGEPLFTEEQQLTHRRVRVDVVAARVAARARLVAPGDPGYDALAWHRTADAVGGTLGVSSLTAAILRRLTDENAPWSSTPRPSPSSPRATRRSSTASPRSATTSTTTTSARPRRARRRGSTSSSTTTAR